MNLEVSGDQAVWLPTDTSATEAERFIQDPNWCAQVKEDGVHVLAARLDGDRISTRNRKGQPHGVPSVITDALLALPPQTIVDGEKLHEGGFVLFDVLYFKALDLRALPYSARLATLTQQVMPRLDQERIWLVEYEVETAKKRALVERLQRENAEGAIFKDLRSPYRPGRPAEGGPMRRFKFKKSLTCIVQRRSGDTKASFEVYLINRNGQPLNIGSVSAQQFFNELAPGEVRIAELEYLYATPNNRIVQPVLKRPSPWRGDKAPEECTLDQLIKGGRFASNRSAAR